MDWETYGLNGVAKRAVFVMDGNGEITYAWVVDGIKTEPDYDEVIEAADAVAAC